MVNINTVYERVLFLANKEQRGYITPDEFNSFSEQAQLEIFNDYFTKKVQTQQLPGVTDEYGDIAKIAEERLTYFDNTLNIIAKSDLGDPAVQGFAYPENFWTLGQINHTDIPSGRTAMLDEVSHRDLTYINLSPHTAPTVKQPVYTRHEDGIVAYPEAVSSITMIYLRKPNTPIWGFLDDPVDGLPIYDPRPYTVVEGGDDFGSTDFELSPAEEPNLVYRILALAGVTIKQGDIAQFGQQNTQ